jgi:hypothetical protein
MGPCDRLRWRTVIPLWVLTGCSTLTTPGPVKPPASQPAPAPVAPPGMSVEKVREELQVAPWEIAVCGVRGEPGPTETITARNIVDRPVTITAIQVMGEAAPAFKIDGRPSLPATVPAKGSLSVELTLQPPADATPGLKRGVLRFQTGATLEDGPAADLAALVTRGREPDAEPPLQEIIESLGYAVDVGARTLKLPKVTQEGAAGAGTAIAFFKRARTAPVAINPVARFSADGRVPFGYFLPGTSLKTVDQRRLAVLAEGQHQTLNPSIEPGGFTSFDPGDNRFGIWMGPDERVTYSETRRNRGKQRGLARVYPLRARGGAAVADTYLIAFGEEARADYQDVVFVLWNVTPSE